MNWALFILLIVGNFGLGWYTGGKKGGLGLLLYGSALLYFVYRISL